MTENEKFKLSRIQLDALGELGNIGAGKAGVALSKFLARDVSMSLPHTSVITGSPLKAFSEEFLKEKEVTLITLSTVLPSTFDLYCAVTKESIDKLLQLMFHEPEIAEKIKSYHRTYLSLIKEIGSILLIQYVTALNKYLNVEHTITNPHIFIGSMKENIEEAIKEKAIICRELNERTISIKLSIFTVEENISFELIIVPCKDTINTFLDALNIPSDM